MPLETQYSKMVLAGIALKCLNPILTIICSLSYKYVSLIFVDKLHWQTPLTTIVQKIELAENWAGKLRWQIQLTKYVEKKNWQNLLITKLVDKTQSTNSVDKPHWQTPLTINWQTVDKMPWHTLLRCFFDKMLAKYSYVPKELKKWVDKNR